jgi:hypothetical protein
MCACIEIHRSGSSSPGWTCLCLLVLDLMEEERIRTSLEAFGHSIRPHAREAVTGLHRVAASARPLLLLLPLMPPHHSFTHCPVKVFHFYGK